MKKLTAVEQLLRTVCYSDLFDYPLTRKEIQTWWIGGPIMMSSIDNALKGTRYLHEYKGYYCFNSRDVIIRQRIAKKTVAQKKMLKAHKAASLLARIPSVRLVGVTGGLAMENAAADDDIDFFIITSPGIVWTTRFIATLFSDVLGIRRKPGETRVRDKICLNMFIAEDHLSLPHNERDLYAAHEILQMVPLVNKSHDYERFLAANDWVSDYLPNAWKEKRSTELVWDEKDDASFGGKIVETVMKKLQLMYMRKKRTIEIVSDTMIRFHPEDVGDRVMKMYQRRISALD